MCIILRKSSPSFWDPKPGFWAHTAQNFPDLSGANRSTWSSHQGKQNPTLYPRAFVLLAALGGKWSWQLSWRIPVPEKCPEPNSSGRPSLSLSPPPLSSRDLFSQKRETKSRAPAPIQLKEQTFVFSGTGGSCLCVGVNSEHQLSPECTHYSSWMLKNTEDNLLFLPLVATA